MRDLTTGSPFKKIIVFCLPLLIGTLFQQFYSLADSIIVGKYLGVNAFAAVGSTGALNFLILGFALGICSGCAIPVAQSFGAGSVRDVRAYTGQIVLVSLGVSIFIVILTFFTTKPILRLLDTPAEIFDDAYTYIFMIFMGSGATILYNMAGGVLRALGDSRMPLVFLILAALVNIALDILFISVFGMGVEGAAYATVLSQLLSGLACIEYIRRRVPILHFSKADLKPCAERIFQLLRLGLPMGLQFSITAIGSIILQGAVNSLGATMVAAVSAGGKVSGIVTAPFDSMGMTMATYCGQNLGAGAMDRVHRGVRCGTILGIAYSVFAGIVIHFFGTRIACVFMDAAENEILANVQIYCTICGLVYPALSLIMIYRNSLQGLGFSTAAMLAGVAELAARSVAAFSLVRTFGYIGVCFANPLAWVAADVILLPMYFILIPRLDRAHPAPAK